MPTMKNITPPTTRKLCTEMPKNLNNSCPVKAKAMIVISPTIEAFLAVRFLSATDSSVVIDRNIGIIPKGFMRVKNEVKHKSPYVANSDIIFLGFYMFLSKSKAFSYHNNNSVSGKQLVFKLFHETSIFVKNKQ